jgi:hypothetical protein
MKNKQPAKTAGGAQRGEKKEKQKGPKRAKKGNSNLSARRFAKCIARSNAQRTLPGAARFGKCCARSEVLLSEVGVSAVHLRKCAALT